MKRKQPISQHYVPRTYIKAWYAKVEQNRKPEIKFDGVYVFENNEKTGDGRTKDAILCKNRLYTVRFKHFCYFLNDCPNIYADFIDQINNILLNTYSTKVYGLYKGVKISSKRTIKENLSHIDDWEFYYSDGKLASKKKIMSMINSMTSYVLENSFDLLFENDWSELQNSFTAFFYEDAIPIVPDGNEIVIPMQIAENMLKFVIITLFRNPKYDALGAYKKAKHIFDGIVPEDLTDEILQAHWYKALYNALYNSDNSFFYNLLNTILPNCQIILFKRKEGALPFITSDNPSFLHISAVSSINLNGLYFPLSPDFLILICKGKKNSINIIDCRYANSIDIRTFNNIIYNERSEIAISNIKHLHI